MNKSDSDRLAQIRAQNEKWLAQDPNAWMWDTTFLLRLLDAKTASTRWTHRLRTFRLALRRTFRRCLGADSYTD